MNGKTRDGLWIVVEHTGLHGGTAHHGRPGREAGGLYRICRGSVLFVAFGIGLVIYAIRDLTKPVEETEADQRR